MSLKTYSLNDETKTNLIAHNDNDNTNLDVKVQQKCDSAKSDVNKLNEFKTSNGEIWGFTINGKIISTQAWQMHLPWLLRMETGITNIILLEIEHFSLNFQARSASNS